jgi:hypothetical protein
MINNTPEYLILRCECKSPDHLVSFEKPKDEDDLLVISVNLNQYNKFWRRLILGIRYIFGFDSENSHWDVVLLDKQEQNRIINFLTKE